MAKKKNVKIYRWYLISAIIYSIFTILTGLLLIFPKLFIVLTFIPAPIIFGWFVFSIVMFFRFRSEKVERIGLWLPGLYIFDFVFSGIVGIIIGIVAIFKDVGISQLIRTPLIMTLGLIIPAVALTLAIKLIIRK